MASRPEMQGVARVGELVGALKRIGVDSATALCEVWRSDTSFLQREVQMWVNQSNHGKLLKAWTRLMLTASKIE
jgi:ATP-dependent RNA helicase DHX37/DHR1